MITEFRSCDSTEQIQCYMSNIISPFNTYKPNIDERQYLGVRRRPHLRPYRRQMLRRPSRNCSSSAPGQKSERSRKIEPMASDDTGGEKSEGGGRCPRTISGLGRRRCSPWVWCRQWWRSVDSGRGPARRREVPPGSRRKCRKTSQRKSCPWFVVAVLVPAVAGHWWLTINGCMNNFSINLGQVIDNKVKPCIPISSWLRWGQLDQVVPFFCPFLFIVDETRLERSEVQKVRILLFRSDNYTIIIRCHLNHVTGMTV